MIEPKVQLAVEGPYQIDTAEAVAQVAIAHARDLGDTRLLLQLLRSKECAACAYAADLIQGKRKLPEGRPPRDYLRLVEMHHRVVVLEGEGLFRKEAVAKAAEEYGVSKRTVREAIRFRYAEIGVQKTR